MLACPAHIPATPAWTRRSKHGTQEGGFAAHSPRLKSLYPHVCIQVAADFFARGHANVSFNSLLILPVLYNKGRSFPFIGAGRDHTFLITCPVPRINCKKPCLTPSISTVLSTDAKYVTPHSPCWPPSWLSEGKFQACAHSPHPKEPAGRLEWHPK